jgi:phosphomannomutase
MIFKAYDIRGIVPDQLDPDVAYGIGRATAHHFEVDEIAVGRDARTHSPELAEALIEGIRDEGVDVVDLGLVSTPMLYFAVDHLDTGGGVMVTASHNPGQYNGFKLCREHAIPVGEASGLKEIEALTASRAQAHAVSPRGALRVEAVLDAYVDHVLAVASSRPKLRVAIDCGNGMAGRALVPLLERLPLEVERLYFEPDGTFPHHEADPLKRENLEDLIQAVRRSNADFGVAFDGDGDRACFVDEQGEPISSDLITALLGCYQLKRAPRGRVLYDLRSSRAVAEEIERAGGRPEMCRVGHSFVKAQMRETGAIFAGELSGHFYFRFSNTLVADDGTAAFIAMLDVLADRDEPLSKIVAPLRRYTASGEINRRVADVSKVLKTIEAEQPEGAEISKLDGLLVRYPEWWFNLRPSNTEPVLRLNLEADTPERMVAERDRLLHRIEELGA